MFDHGTEHEQHHNRLPQSWTKTGPPSGHGLHRSTAKRPWLPVAATIVGIVLFAATCTLANRSIQSTPNQAERWASLIGQGRWNEAHEIMCDETTAQTSVPSAGELAADFGDGANGPFIDWDSFNDGSTSATGLVSIGGEDHLITVTVAESGDVDNSGDGGDWLVCGYTIRPLD